MTNQYDLMNEVKTYWETCKEETAHLLGKKAFRLTTLAGQLVDKLLFFAVDLKNKVVIDYGCGGGYLGKFMFDTYGIKKYIGVDIAERSLNTARRVLEDYSNCSFHLTPIEFKDLHADVFVSLACIQHFPTKEYLDDFLSNLNRSGIGVLALQIRVNDEPTFDNAYMTGEVPDRTCRTNHSYLDDRLTNYSVVVMSPELEDNNYQYIVYRRNKIDQ